MGTLLCAGSAPQEAPWAVAGGCPGCLPQNMAALQSPGEP